MAKKGGGGKGSFWDNPFGGMFDFNRDGKEDFGEQWLAFKIFEECTKEEKDTSYHSSYDPVFDFDDDSSIDTSWREYCEDGSEFGVDPEDYETEDEYEEALETAKVAWRDTCEDGSEFSVDPEDYETEDEYNEALEAAKVAWRDTCEDGSDFDIDPEDYETEDEYIEALDEARQDANAPAISLQVSVGSPASDDEEEEIKESNYPNKRRYNAAYTLANDYLCYSDDEYGKKEKACCQFIVEQADSVIAANYLAHDTGFLYAQAIKDNFTLPISLPDEDEARVFELSNALCKIAKKNIPLSFEVWEWCLEQFLPYAHYDEYAASDLTNAIIDDLYQFPDNYRTELVRYMDKNTDFRDKVLGACKDLADHLPELIVEAIKDGLFQTAEAIFKSGLAKANGQWKPINELVKDTIDWCKDYEELETIEHFKNKLFPLVRAIDIGMVKDEVEEWEQDIDKYISQVEEDSEKYAYSRRFAWRKTVPDGSEYNLDPRYYDTEQEYLEALNEEKYGWRDWYRDQDNFGLDPDTFETQDAFRDARNARQEEKRRLEREERQKQREAQIEAQRQARIESDKAAMSDKNIYTYCGVALPFSSRPYSYRTDDETIKIGDTVIVPIGEDQKEMKGTVVSVGQFMRVAAPYPVEKTKFILRKINEETE